MNAIPTNCLFYGDLLIDYHSQMTLIWFTISAKTHFFCRRNFFLLKLSLSLSLSFPLFLFFVHSVIPDNTQCLEDVFNKSFRDISQTYICPKRRFYDALRTCSLKFYRRNKSVNISKMREYTRPKDFFRTYLSLEINCVSLLTYSKPIYWHCDSLP